MVTIPKTGTITILPVTNISVNFYYELSLRLNIN